MIGTFYPLQGPVPSAPQGHTWVSLMDRALSLARKAEEEGEIPVGALIVDPMGRIVGEGSNRSLQLCDPSAHAEIVALRAAGQRLQNYRLDRCVLIVTLEPCAMCAAALVHARIAGVVFGAADSLAGAVVSRLDLLDQPFFNHRVWHMGGVSSQACTDILQGFFTKRRFLHE